MTSDRHMLAPYSKIAQVPTAVACTSEHDSTIDIVSMPAAPPTSNCHLCGDPITERFYVFLSPNLVAHEACLSCRVCAVPLHLGSTCFLKSGYVYCTGHYRGLFLTCTACGRVPSEGEVVRKVSNMLYHAACVRCAFCGIIIGTGQRAIRDPDGIILCLCHAALASERYLTPVSDPSSPSSSSSSSVTLLKSLNSSHQNSLHSPPNSTIKTSRSRTVLSEAQVHTLRSFYEQNPRPDSYIKEQLAGLTGLTTRVIRVWFQNNRCKDKKRQQHIAHLNRRRGIEDTTLREKYRSVDLPSVGELHCKDALLGEKAISR